MKRLALLIALVFLVIPSARAQWIAKSYPLTKNDFGGWYGIWLGGDATYGTIDQIFAAYPEVVEVWRWNPNPAGAQFSQATTTTSASTDTSEWSVWKRDGSETGLSRMIGNSAYLIHTTSPTTISITQSILAPVDQWLITGSNFLGFPAKSGAVINNYFASLIVNGASGLPTGTKIYSYVGGDLGAANPVQINTSAASSVKTLDPNTAYWFSVPAVSDFTGAVEYEVPGGSLSYGRDANTITVGITNRSTAALTLTFSMEASAPAPGGQPTIKANVPLNISTINSDGSVTLAPVAGATISVPASGRVNLDLALDRSSVSGSSSDLYASILRIQDSAGFTDVRLGVSAQPASYAGLWLCDVQVTGVGDSLGQTATSATSRAFPVQFLMHQGSGYPVLVRQVFLGQLKATGAMGLTTTEKNVQASGTSTVEPARFYSPMLPYSSNTFPGSGTLGSGTAQWTFTHAFDDPVNPFVHEYHPDHDNLDAKLKPLSAGSKSSESYDVIRTCRFTFSNAPGSTSLSGTYSETLTGLNKAPISVSGSFTMHRLSEIDTLTP